MKQSRFTDSQIMAILKRGESGVPVMEICQMAGVGELRINSARAVSYNSVLMDLQ